MLDSGATSHMTGSKSIMTELRPNIANTMVSYGDKTSSQVLGFGKVVVTPDVSLVDVMLVKTLGYNLLSVRALALMGLSSFFNSHSVVLMWSKSLKVAFVGYVEHDLYVVDFSGTTTPHALCLYAKADKGWLWHRRLAHVNMRTLQRLHSEGHILGINDVSFAKDRVCRACIEGKMHETPHKALNQITTERCLELLHMDLFGPPSHDSLGGKKYCLVIVDDFSRYTWVFFFKYKSETQQTVIDFANEVQRKHNATILSIRSDNGTEFKNYTLDEFLSDEGIKHQYSTPYTPQQNGVAERKNRTLMDAARSMLAEFKSPYNFWAEAISTACHATNRLYLRKNKNKTPYELLTGKKPNVSYFRVFGCKCYILKKGVRLSKFESKAQEGIFVGYSNQSHAYRVYNKANGRVEETSNVKFDENHESLVRQDGVCDPSDEIPPKAIGRMGVGFHLPIEDPLMDEGEGPSSTQVEPSLSQDHLAPQGPTFLAQAPSSSSEASHAHDSPSSKEQALHQQHQPPHDGAPPQGTSHGQALHQPHQPPQDGAPPQGHGSPQGQARQDQEQVNDPQGSSPSDDSPEVEIDEDDPLQAPKNKLFINNINLPTMGLLLKAPPTDKLFINLINLPKMGLLLKVTVLPKVKLVKIKSKSMILKDPLQVMTPPKWKLMKMTLVFVLIVKGAAQLVEMTKW